MSVTETKHLGVPMPATLRKELQEVADRNDRSAAAEARLAIKAHVELHTEAEQQDDAA